MTQIAWDDLKTAIAAFWVERNDENQRKFNLSYPPEVFFRHYFQNPVYSAKISEEKRRELAAKTIKLTVSDNTCLM